ncbi:hypothetical protein BDZ97DRAFT_811131 [Flammula alnicola]|nr:hypothetical protein BDZ97DRAFT_811131 [Flammula alnicola]
MHECAVCGKKFPRPSGLKTHMNIHSNEKPYPCGFPGCSRTFGVRSNAKRHLRTHGVYPAPANASPPVDPPYVVGFSTPMVLPPQPQDVSLRGAGIGSDGLQSELHSVKIDSAEDQSGFARGQDAGQPSQNHMSRASAFKLRWMPPSLTSRTNASLLREVRDGQISDDHAHGLWQNRGPWTRTPMKVDEADEKEGGDFTMDMDVKEEDREPDTVRDEGKYGDAASAERFSIPLRPILPSFASVSTGLSLASRDGSNASSLGLGSETSYGSCRSSSSASFTSFTSISPSTSATSFATPSPSASNSLLLPSSSVYGHRKPAGARELDLNGSLNMDFEERNSYMSVGSHPYHPSQFSVLPGPAVASAATTYVVA